MPASKRCNGALKSARETWLVAHMRRSASAVLPRKAGAVCASSEGLGRNTASVRREKPPSAAATTRQLLRIDVDVTDPPLRPARREAQEARAQGGIRDEREARGSRLRDEGPHVGERTEPGRDRGPGAAVRRRLERQVGRDQRIAPSEPER